MKTKAESMDILDDWVVSKIDHSTEDPNFGFIETLYQTCSAALASLWKSQFRMTKAGPHKSILKNDIASIQLWDENFPSGHLDTILAESSDLKIIVLENLTAIGKILVPYFTDSDEAICGAQNESDSKRKFANDLEMQLEKAALMFDPEEMSEPSSDDDTSDDSSSTTERHQNRLGRLHSYISCLVDLAPLVERYVCSLQYKAEVQSVPIETAFHLSHRAQPYAMRIRDRFTNAPTSLIERLAEANLERSIRLRTQADDEEEVDDHSNRDAVTLFKPFSLFHDSGIGTSIPTISHYAATVASHTSFLSVTGEEACGRPRVPSLPQECGRRFQCDYCHRTISVRNRIEWKMHVFADLQSYICTHEDCKDALKTFPTRKLWADHEFNEHFTLLRWRCFTCSLTTSSPELFVEHLAQAHGIILTGQRLTAAISQAKETVLTPVFKDQKCLLCSQAGWQTKKAYAIHVGQHLEEISLACLPRNEEDSSEDGFDTNIPSTSASITRLTSVNGEEYEVDADSEAQYKQPVRPAPVPDPIPAYRAREEREDSKPAVKIDMGTPETTSLQDIPGALFPSSSLSNEQSAGSGSVRPSSYWSVAERDNFKMLLAHFGEDFEGISRFMKTKTPVMVRNYFKRRLDAGNFELGEAARDAEARKARGDPQHPLTIPRVATRQPEPFYRLENLRLEPQKRDDLEPNNIERLSKQQYDQILTVDHWERPKAHQDDQQQQEDWISATEANTGHAPGVSNHLQNVPFFESRGDLSSFVYAANASSSNDMLVTEPVHDDSEPWNAYFSSSIPPQERDDGISIVGASAPTALSVTESTPALVPDIPEDSGSSLWENYPTGNMGPSHHLFPDVRSNHWVPSSIPQSLLELGEWSVPELNIIGSSDSSLPVIGNLDKYAHSPSYQASLTRGKAVSESARHQNVAAANQRDINQLSDTPPVTSKSGSQPSKQSKPHYRCPTCNTLIMNRGVFMRHVGVMHYPQYEYRCHVDNCSFMSHRRDKLLGHYRHSHYNEPPRKSIIEQTRKERVVALICPLCNGPINTWKEFYECILDHSIVKEDKP